MSVRVLAWLKYTDSDKKISQSTVISFVSWTENAFTLHARVYLQKGPFCLDIFEGKKEKKKKGSILPLNSFMVVAENLK